MALILVILLRFCLLFMDNNYSERIVCLGHVFVTFVQEARNTVNDVTWQTTETYFPTLGQKELKTSSKLCYILAIITLNK